MSDWPIKNISDVAEFLNQKRIPVKSLDRQKRRGQYPYYGASGVVDYIDDYIFDGTYLLISEDGENLQTRNTPIAFKASGKFWVNNHAHILAEKEEGILDYLEYYFSKLDLTPYITGAVQPKLNKANLDRIEISVPEKEERLAINKILNSLTNKIELNRQINQTLEHIAQAIFKSWFVDFEPVKAKIIAREKGGNKLAQSLAAQSILCGALTLQQLQDMDAGYRGLEHELHPLITNRFPDQPGLDFWTPETLDHLAALFPDELEDDAQGCASAARDRTPGAASELEEIPKGWEIKPLSKMIELTGGGTPKRSEESYWGGDIPWFSVKDAPNDEDVFVIDTNEKITEAGLNKSSAKLLPEGVTIITARGTVGRLALVGVPMAMNQSCYGVKGANGIGHAFNYFNLKQALSTLKRQTHGAVFDTITTKTFDSVYVVEPCNNSIKIFEEMVEPLLKRIRNDLFENMSLVECRYSLLPKLLSGEITLGDTQSTAEAVA